MRKAIFCGIGFFVFTITGVYSQHPDLKFFDPMRAFDLPDNNVTCITQDSTGFIWLGTNSGLSCFNGFELKTYKYLVGDSTSLINNEITYLYPDSKGVLWIGTRRGLCYYVQEYDRFKWLIHESINSGVLSGDISNIGEDRNGNIFVSNTISLYRYNEDQGIFSEVFNVGNGELKTFLFDLNNNIWIGTDKGRGLIRIDAVTGQEKTFTVNDNDKTSISSNSPLDIALQGNKLWIATSDGGINLYDIEKDSFKQFPVNDKYELVCRTVYIDKTEKVWITDLIGLKVYDVATDSFSGYYTYSGDQFSIKRSCTGIYQDSQGNYWTLHAGDGVAMTVAQKGFVTYNNSLQDFWHVSEDNVSAVCEDKYGNLWIGNPFNGVDIFYWSENKKEVYRNKSSDRYSIGEGALLAIFRDSKDIMWVGTNMGGLQYFNEKEKRFISYRNNPKDNNTIANNDIRSITEDGNGDLWLVVHGKGIDRFDRQKGVFIHYNSENSNLSNDYAFQVLHDSYGNIWVATVWGVSVLNKGKNQFKNYYQIENDSNSLSDNEIISIYEDDDKNIWIGTSDGLNRYNRQKDNFDRFNPGFSSNTINAILSDKKGIIWIGTSRGISMLNPSTGEYRNFNRRDGIVSSEIYPRAGYRNKQNEIFFGGNNGINKVSPDKLIFNTKPPRVYISGLILFNREITEYSPTGILQKQILLTESLRLKSDQNVITFKYIALDYTSPVRTRYSYKLEGFDKDWIMAGSRREVTYTNLDPKRYVFRVKASNGDGYWNETGDSLELIVLPPWYGTVLFKVLSVLFLIWLIGTIVFIRTNRLRRQKVILEEQVKERTLELTSKNELLQKQAVELNKANEELRQAYFTKNKLFSIIAHDIINPFNTLLGFTDVLREDYHRINDEEKLEIINMIGTSSDRIHELLENLLKWTKSQTGKITVIQRVFRIGPTVNNALTIFEYTAKQKNISVQSMIPEDTYVYADEDMVSTILRNLLNNAIKFTPSGGNVTVSAENTDDKVTIYVADTGIGIAPDIANTLFSSVNKELKAGTMGEKGSGLGLLICKDFADINNGSMSVKSEPGKGSTFGLTLPSSDRS